MYIVQQRTTKKLSDSPILSPLPSLSISLGHLVARPRSHLCTPLLSSAFCFVVSWSLLTAQSHILVGHVRPSLAKLTILFFANRHSFTKSMESSLKVNDVIGRLPSFSPRPTAEDLCTAAQYPCIPANCGLNIFARRRGGTHAQSKAEAKPSFRLWD
ncbi:hypothetical protein K439DRAFT_682993 [Ramaria rubella]|nr:hypothetical protein K439DRAFT_682993 [Ramaria rubella]